MKLIIASNNKNKIKEFKKIFENTDFELLSLEEVGFFDEIEETGQTFKENALIKAKTIADTFNMPAIADDSGVMIKALDNRPGVYSARYAGDNHDDAANNAKMIKEMEGILDREAKYVCAICFYLPNGKNIIIEEDCKGYITLEPIGNNGFGYDPYFYVQEFNKTMAELTLDEKNSISHRSKALERFKKEYAKVINS